MAKPKVDSTPMRCILSPGHLNTARILRELNEANLDVVERHELDDGYILLVVESLPFEVEQRLHDIAWTAVMTPREVTSFLSNVKRGIPSLRIFPKLQGR